MTPEEVVAACLAHPLWREGESLEVLERMEPPVEDGSFPMQTIYVFLYTKPRGKHQTMLQVYDPILNENHVSSMLNHLWHTVWPGDDL